MPRRKPPSDPPVEAASAAADLTPDGQETWRKLRRLLPYNEGPRLLYALVDRPLLRRRLAEELAAECRARGEEVVLLDWREPHGNPLADLFEASAAHPEARYFFLLGLERSLHSPDHRGTALFTTNFHRDQVQRRLHCPVLFWIPDSDYTDLALRAPDFVAWRGGVFPLRDRRSKAEAEYREHVTAMLATLTLYSARSDEPVPVDLEQVFVPLGVVKDPDTLEAAMAFLAAAAPTPRGEGTADAKPPAPETVTLGEALARSPRLALIGDAGSGKTTLMRFLALTFARQLTPERLGLDEERLPVYVPLREFNHHLGSSPDSERGTDSLEWLPCYLAAQNLRRDPPLDLDAQFFQTALSEGRCVVLLDGLDEVVREADRVLLHNWIRELVAQYPENRFVLTSRPRGYTDVMLPFATAHLRELTDVDVEQVARNWYRAVTRKRRGETLEADDDALRQADDLLKALKAEERVGALARNPLLLTVLAMVHQRGVGLPERRAELYDECTDLLLGYWDQVKGGEAARELAELGGLGRAEKRALIQPVALWLHERGDTGFEASEAELLEKIAEQCREMLGDKEEKARERARLFLRLATERAGLLVERSPGVYAFAHLTFQEYLAARAIADREDYIEYTLRWLHHPWWREVHLLEVGHLSDVRQFGRRARKLTSDLIRAIYQAESWLEDVLHRDLFLAFRAMIDAGRMAVDEPLRQELWSSFLASWQVASDPWTLLQFGSVANRVRAAEDRDEVLEFVRGQLRTPSSARNMSFAIEKMPRLRAELRPLQSGSLSDDRSHTYWILDNSVEFSEPNTIGDNALTLALLTVYGYTPGSEFPENTEALTQNALAILGRMLESGHTSVSAREDLPRQVILSMLGCICELTLRLGERLEANHMFSEIFALATVDRMHKAEVLRAARRIRDPSYLRKWIEAIETPPVRLLLSRLVRLLFDRDSRVAQALGEYWRDQLECFPGPFTRADYFYRAVIQRELYQTADQVARKRSG